jgi:hypothetical protein
LFPGHYGRGPNGPDVGEVVTDVQEQWCVVLAVLADERGLVTAVHCLVAEPWRQRAGGSKLGLGAHCDDAGRAEVRGDCERAGVAEPELGSGLAARESVSTERLLESLPHEYGRVVLPPVIGLRQCAYDLNGLRALLAEPLAIQGTRRALEVGVGQEGLHCSSVPANREPIRRCSTSV